MTSKSAKPESKAPIPSGAARQRLVRALAEIIAERRREAAERERLRSLYR